MLSPRHRYNYAAIRVGLKPDLDGLTNKAAPDEITKMLESGLRSYMGVPTTVAKPTGRSKAKSGPAPSQSAFIRAYEIYKEPGARRNFDAALLTTQSVADTARVLREKEEVVQLYADCFFDLAAFEGGVDRGTYLDAIFPRDPEYAQMLRNMISLPTEQLMFLINSSTGERVDPKTVLETGMSMHYNFMRIFSQIKLETLVATDVDSADFKRFRELFSMMVTSSNLALKFAGELLKNDLDKDRVNFLEEFVLNLSNKGLSHYISSPKTEPLELV